MFCSIKNFKSIIVVFCLVIIAGIPFPSQAIRAPFEAGLHIRETYLTFNEQLIDRPKTDAIVVHHVARPDWDVDAYYIHRFHQSKGWAGIGYQYVIRKDGTIERGRPFNKVGAQSYGNNFHSLGVCVVGNLEVDDPTPAQVKSLTSLLTALCGYYDLTPNEKTIVGHRDYNATDCPGENLYKLLPEIRTQVRADLAKSTHKTQKITHKVKRK